MKISLAAEVLARPEARTPRNILILNLMLLPGLGTVIAGRRIAGCCQILLALSGACLLIVWFSSYVMDWLNFNDPTPIPMGGSKVHLGLLGMMLLITTWAWSLGTSLAFMKAKPKNEERNIR